MFINKFVFVLVAVDVFRRRLSTALAPSSFRRTYLLSMLFSQLMPIRYFEAHDVKELVERIVSKLGFYHIDLSGIYCFRSTGSKSRRTVARIHSLGKLWQKALNKHSAYLIEVISERYDRLNREEKEKVIIHELLHIPKGFAGGFRPHRGHITKHKIETLHQKYTTKT